MDVLVVVDAQNDFIDGVLGSDAAKAVVPNIVEKIENFHGVIIATMDSHLDTYLNTQEGKHLPVVHCQMNTEGWQINTNIMTALINSGCDQILPKDKFGADNMVKRIMRLDEAQQDDHIDEVVLVGYCTDICVIMNAMLLKNAMPGVEITVDASCCAGTTPKNHKAALQVMKSCQINIIGDEDV